MPQSIFITGADGFIGQILVQRLAKSADYSIKILTRQPQPSDGSDAPYPQQIIGDLLQPESYRAELAGCDTVVHLAAITGKAAPDAYERVNVEGTRVLLQACQAAGVRRFLHMSTIAAGYADQSFYPYARTKAKGEVLVKESGLDFAIVRPTLVLGEKSPIWNTLAKIAGLPVIPLPEGAGPVRVQPIHADDVARGIALLLASGRFDGKVLELGGPHPMMFREFLALVQMALRGEAGRIVSVPLWPFRAPLALVEPVLRPRMPVTAGQLAVFANDSTAAENWLLAQLRDGMPSTGETIAALVDARSAGTQRGSGVPPVKPPARPMSDSAKRVLKAECRTFCVYLTDSLPSPYVSEHYVRAAHARGLAFDDDFSRFDQVTLQLARQAPLLTRCADAYCALLHRTGVLRCKLIMLAAILEHVVPTNDIVDRVQAHHAILTVLSLIAYGSMSAASLALGVLVLVPARVFCWVAARSFRPGMSAGSAK